MSNLETEIAAEYGVTVDEKEAGIDEPWNTERGGIDSINAASEWTGQIVAWLALGLVLTFVADVLFKQFATSIRWANDFGYFLYSIHFIIGAAFTLKRNGHIRTDFVYRNWGARRQGLTDAVVYGLLFIPALAGGLWIAADKGRDSFRLREEVITSNSGLPLWVLKVALPVGLALWLLQSISEFVKSVRVVRDGDWDFEREDRGIKVGVGLVGMILAAIGALLIRAASTAGSRSADDFLGIPDEWLGIVMLLFLFLAIIVGFPIAQTLLVMSFGFGFIGFGSTAFNLFTSKTYEVMTDVTLAAVPLFLLMGYVLEQAGLMDRLFRALQLSLANLKGSLYLAVIAAATIFAAATGIVGASVTLIGLMAIPSMTRSGYDTKLSAGAITAGGTLGILIPPSIMLVVMAPVVGVKVLDLFAAAIIPGFLLSGLYTGYAMFRAWRNPELGPPLPEDEQADSVGEVVKEIALGIIPPMVLIAATLGSILAGWATPTEASAMGAAGSLLLALFGGKMNFRMLRRSLIATLETSSMIMILIVASNFFGAVFSRLGSATYVADGLVSLSLHWILMLILILIFIFILGWPLVANRLAVSTGRSVGVLPQGSCATLGPQGHLRRHVPVHGTAARGPGPRHCVPIRTGSLWQMNVEAGPNRVIGSLVEVTWPMLSERFGHVVVRSLGG